MSRSMRITLVGLLVVMASLVLVENNHGTASILANAAGAPGAVLSHEGIKDIQEQIRQLQVDRKRLLERHAKDMKKSLEHGRGSILDYTQARINASLAGIELCETKTERIEIRREVVTLWKEMEKAMKREIDRGQRPAIELSKISVAALEAEIELLSEQLKE